MVDRLEELLAQVADEDDEEQEDALALETKQVLPATPAPGSEGRPEGAPEQEGRKETGQGECPAPAQPKDGELWGKAFRAGGERLPEVGPLSSSHGNGLTVLRVPGAEDGQTAGPRPEEPSATAAPPALGTAERGLEELYRRAAQAGRPAAQSLPVEQAGRPRHAEEPGRAAALTVEELDRAVRRDSRRYDGGISIF